MKTNAVIAVALVAIIIVAGAAAVLTMNGGDESTETDFAGYEIKPVSDLDSGIVAVGQDSFRWMTYFGLASKCVMVDMNDKTNYMGKSFMYVGKAQAMEANKDLKFTSSNCAITPEDVRTIINLKPSIVIVPAEMESSCSQEMAGLREAGLNIYHIANIYTFLENGTFELTSDMVMQIDGLGKVLNMKDRAESIKEFVKDTVSDILSLSGTVTDDKKRTGYIGAIAYNGAHGIDSSTTYYMPFELAGVKNIMTTDSSDVDSNSRVGTYSAKTIKEKMKDDTILFIDATGAFKCTTETDKGIMQLFADHEAYMACPYIWTGMNFENVLVGAYQIMHDVYGLLSDDELEDRIDEIYEGFLGSSDSLRSETASGVPAPEKGTSVYDDMSDLYEQRRGNPIYGKISVSESGIVFI